MAGDDNICSGYGDFIKKTLGHVLPVEQNTEQYQKRTSNQSSGQM